MIIVAKSIVLIQIKDGLITDARKNTNNLIFFVSYIGRLHIFIPLLLTSISTKEEIEKWKQKGNS